MKHQGTSPKNVTELLLSPIVQTAAQLAIRNNRYALTRPLFGFGGDLAALEPSDWLGTGHVV